MASMTQNWQSLWEETKKQSSLGRLRSDLSEKERLNRSAESGYKHYYSKRNQDDPQRKRELEEEMNRMKRFITKDSTVLDIGAGLGRLAIPLAKEVHKLTAIEPARIYMNTMKDKAARDGVSNMEFSETLWADFPLQEKYDVVCSTWSGAVRDPVSLMKMHEASRGYCILEMGASPSDNDDFEQLYSMVMGENFRYPGNYLNIITTLYDHEIYANLETWKYDTAANYQNIEDIVELRRIGFENYTHVTAEMVEQFRQFYKARMNPDGSYTSHSKGVSCMIWWKV